MLSQQSVSKASVMLSVFAVAGGLLGCLRESLVAYIFGPGAALDAYLAAFMVPTVITNLLNATVPFVFIHLVNKVRADLGEAAAWRFAIRFLGRMVWVLAGLTALCLVFWKPVLGLLAAGFGENQLLQARTYFWLLTPSIIMTGLFIYSTAILQSCKHFFWPALTAMSANFFIIVSVALWGRSLGLASLAFGFMAGAVFQCGALLLVLRRYQVRQTEAHPGKASLVWDDWWHLIVPVVLVFILDQGLFVVTRSLASYLAQGSISVLYFANTVLQLIQMVITIPIIRAIYPYLNDLESVRARLLTTLKIYLIITIPAVLGIGLLDERLIQLLFQRGAFDADHTRITAQVLLIYVLTLIPVGLGNIFLMVLFSQKKVWGAVLGACAALAVNWIAGRMLMGHFGVIGLSGAVLLAGVANFVILLYFFNLQILKIAWRDLRGHLIRVGWMAGAMGLITLLLDSSWGIDRWLVPMPSPVKLSVIVALSTAFYMGLGYWSGMNEIVYVVEKIKRALRR